MKKIIEMFEREIAEHELKIIVDNGANRILEFRNKNGSSNQFFNVLQTRHRICFTGDMGDFVFTNHDEDMLAWFHGNMSLSYIAEKCRTGEALEYSESLAREVIKDCVDMFCRDYLDDYLGADCEDDYDFEVSLASWQQALYDEVDDGIDFETEETLHRTAYDISIEVNDNMKFEIDMCDGIDCTEYTHRFKWCALAMNKVAELYFSLVSEA